MRSLTTLLAACGLASAAIPPNPYSTEYYLKTQVTPGQNPLLSRFSGLYLDAFHYGAGLNDPVFATNKNNAVKGFLASVNNATGGPNGHYGIYRQLFDMGEDNLSNMDVEYTLDANSAWQPVKIFAGEGNKNDTTQDFYNSAQGLRWTTQPEKPGSTLDRFAGWLVCDWWHLQPQLFVELTGFGPANKPIPPSCAKVDLLFEYTTTPARQISVQ